MKSLLTLLIVCFSTTAFSQIKMQLTPAGFPSVKIDKPKKTTEKLIENSKSWANYYNRNSRYSFDVYEVTENALSIDAFKENAFYYRNRGEAYQQRIKYKVRIEFSDTFYTITFSVKEIYSGNNLTTLTISDFFKSDGTLKEDYQAVKPSLEFTANSIVNAFAQYIASE